MGLKKRSKVSAEFSMSSLTDIIFLLLIFFMLTSSLVAPNSLNLKLPGSNTKSTPSKEKLDDITIDRKGRFYFNGKEYGFNKLKQTLSSKSRAKRKYTVTISPDSKAPVKQVVMVMDIVRIYKIDGIMAAETK
jgi:biopolymer transport protein ExbD